MIDGLGAVCDEFYVTCRLFLKLEMSPSRETVLHFFDRLRREFPSLRKLRMRDPDSIVLEEDGDAHAARRWVRVDAAGLRLGCFAPPSLEGVRHLAGVVLEQAPFHLTFSDLDYDHLEVIYGFDLSYRGNHDQLVAETLMGEQAGSAFLFADQAAHAIDAQPYYGIALTPACDLQAYVEVKSRTTTFEVRNDAYETEPITVFLTLRKYWGDDRMDALGSTAQKLFDHADELAAERVVPAFVNPLAAAIASRP